MDLKNLISIHLRREWKERKTGGMEIAGGRWLFVSRIEKVPEDIMLLYAPEFGRAELINAAQQLSKLEANRPKSIMAELRLYRKYVPLILRAYFKMSEATIKAGKQIKRCTEIGYDRGGKKWSPEEESELIDKVCEGTMNIHQLSTIFGRSPGAIQTHISELVGRRRLSQEVAGRFVGWIDGNRADVEVHGRVYKGI